jgi:hypothetical protein
MNGKDLDLFACHTIGNPVVAIDELTLVRGW